jgi:hypothetical protein
MRRNAVRQRPRGLERSGGVEHLRVRATRADDLQAERQAILAVGLLWSVLVSRLRATFKGA